MVLDFQGKSPRIGQGCFVARTAVIIGDVEIGRQSSVWYGAVVRGDENYIRIGSRTNVQDNAVCHVTGPDHPLVIGDYVTVGHGAVVHGCTVASHCVIGMGAVVLDGAVVGEGSIVAAGAVVTEGFQVPPRSLVAGTPARVKRELDAADRARIEAFAESYLELTRIYLEESAREE